MNTKLSSIALFAAVLSAPTFAEDKLSCGLSNGKKATGAPIPIGAVVGKTGPDDFSASAKAAKAYFACVNDNGGINGRPVDYTIVDDQWNPEVAAQVASKLVRDKKVVAMVGNTSFVECGANGKLYEQEGLMAIAGVGVPRECFFGKNYVPMNAGPRLSAVVAAGYAKQKYQAKSMVCIVPNIPGLGNWACEGPVAWGKKNGATVETITMDPGSADATSVLLQAVAKKPDAIIFNVPKGLLIPLMNASEQQNLGKKIHFLSTAPAYNVDVPKAIGGYWKDNFDVNLELQPLDGSGPDNRNWLAVLNKYGEKGDQRDTFSQAGYLAARLTTEAMLKLDPAKIDRKTTTEALRRVKDFKSDILCAPFSVGDGARHNDNNSGRMVTTSGSGWKVTTECLPADDPELADIRAGAAKVAKK